MTELSEFILLYWNLWARFKVANRFILVLFFTALCGKLVIFEIQDNLHVTKNMSIIKPFFKKETKYAFIKACLFIHLSFLVPLLSFKLQMKLRQKP